MLWGQDVRPVVEVAPDYESYNYKKLDLENFEVNTFEVFWPATRKTDGNGRTERIEVRILGLLIRHTDHPFSLQFK
ncbi:hypothetical protein EDC04DRAFT_408475 [Pisolithus marmoratus]|nr:hypothetical protein EDC04DRAFT_408475 [Pisolithus marmoratus]